MEKKAYAYPTPEAIHCAASTAKELMSMCGALVTAEDFGLASCQMRGPDPSKDIVLTFVKNDGKFIQINKPASDEVDEDYVVNVNKLLEMSVSEVYYELLYVYVMMHTKSSISLQKVYDTMREEVVMHKYNVTI